MSLIATTGNASSAPTTTTPTSAVPMAAVTTPVLSPATPPAAVSPTLVAAGVASTLAPASAVAAATATSSASAPNRTAKSEITALIVESCLGDAVVEYLVKTPAAITAPILEELAGALKSATVDDVAERVAARVRFIQRFASTLAAPLAGPAFDAACEGEAAYFSLARLGVPEGVVTIENLSVLAMATQAAYKAVVGGGLQESYACLCRILRANPHLVGGELAFSEMDECEAIDGRPLDEADLGRIREQIELTHLTRRAKAREEVQWEGLQFQRTMLEDALRHVASEHSYHAIHEYLRSLPAWDGQPRLDRVATELLGVGKESSGPKDATADRRDHLATIQVRKTFIAAVARAQSPGAKVDTVLILKGAQGKRKSEFFRVITPKDRFSDSDIDLRNKDTLLLLRKVWIYEWSELSVMRNARDVQNVKAFLSSSIDTFRPPYGRRVVSRPRHCIIVGTTNDDEFLADATGNRRFWVVQVSGDKIDTEKAAAWRDQLWAEALAAYEAGEKWWLDDNEDAVRAEVNAEHCEADPWKDLIRTWLENQRSPRPAQTGLHSAGPVDISALTSSQVMAEALGLTAVQQGLREQKRVGAILREFGYFRGFKDGGRVWRLDATSAAPK